MKLTVQDKVTVNQVVVANNTIYPCPNEVMHGSKMMSEHYKVSLGWSYSKKVNQKLPMLSLDNKSIIGQATYHYLMWLVDDIILKEQHATYPKHNLNIFIFFSLVTKYCL